MYNKKVKNFMKMSNVKENYVGKASERNLPIKKFLKSFTRNESEN